MTQKSQKFVLNEETDFTSSALVDYLNEKFKSKKTGEPFKSGDVQQYLRRGYLPKPYGHHPLEELKNTQIGVNLIRVKFDCKHKKQTVKQ